MAVVATTSGDGWITQVVGTNSALGASSGVAVVNRVGIPPGTNVTVSGLIFGTGGSLFVLGNASTLTIGTKPYVFTSVGATMQTSSTSSTLNPVLPQGLIG